ncbi:MFS transporter [Bosea psychrotolerans]|uniref:Putative MFS family arabinose efflux permease n=1 Tax=Bosea psychrotolerans TaxID=1871628 RepID=A0A2S4MQC8_9HYPH|nr:MFS transporter [Bosea psychrotolerans]POR56819.1 putative MFS family arabinose efflux permease [Bosea psychrotolerans]
MDARLLWLAGGAFAIGTGTLIITGILPNLATGFGVSVDTAGLLLTAFAIAYAIGSPVLSTVFGNVERKHVLAGSLAVFTLANLGATLAADFSHLMAARVVMALAAGVYMPAANAVAVALVSPERRARAIALVTGGMTVALILGVPLGTAAAAAGSWHLAFLLVGLFGALALIGILWRLPVGLPRGANTMAERLAVARRGDILLALATTMLWTTGAFTLYGYIAPFLANHAGIAGPWLGAVLVVSGIGSALGNQLGGIASDRYGPERTLVVVLTVLAATLVAASLVAVTLPPSIAIFIIPAILLVWSAAGWAGHPSQMSRLAAMAPDTAVIALSLNASALYVGIAAGSTLGQLTLHHLGTWPLGFVGAVCEVAALAVLWLALRRKRTVGRDDSDITEIAVAAPPAR